METGASECDERWLTLAERYAALWRTRGENAEPPDVFEFLAGYPSASARERLAVSLVDQRETWRIGRGRLVEEYVAGAPEVAADEGCVAELIHGELAAPGSLEKPSISTPSPTVFPRRGRC